MSIDLRLAKHHLREYPFDFVGLARKAEVTIYEVESFVSNHSEEFTEIEHEWTHWVRHILYALALGTKLPEKFSGASFIHLLKLAERRYPSEWSTRGSSLSSSLGGSSSGEGRTIMNKFLSDLPS